MEHRVAVTERRIIVGVTGHRWNEDPIALDDVVEGFLTTVSALAGETGEVIVVSPLAEGADRLVASVGLQLGFRLECILPLPPSEYERDFRSTASVEQFRNLMRRADSVQVVPCEATSSASRSSAYAAVGDEVIGRSDVLVAIWDGQPSRGPGGTAEVVSAARAAGRVVVWVHIDPPHSVQVLAGAPRSEITDALAARLRPKPAHNQKG